MTKSLTTEIRSIKRQLTNTVKTEGLYENFGQAELFRLKEKYNYSTLVYGSKHDRKRASEIKMFEDWAMEYCG